MRTTMAMVGAALRVGMRRRRSPRNASAVVALCLGLTPITICSLVASTHASCWWPWAARWRCLGGLLRRCCAAVGCSALMLKLSREPTPCRWALGATSRRLLSRSLLLTPLLLLLPLLLGVLGWPPPPFRSAMLLIALHQML